MLLRSLIYKNYRGLKDEATKFESVNHIIGKNGAGKTSVIEAAVMLLNGPSFQGTSLKRLSNKDKNHFRLAGTVKQTKTNIWAHMGTIWAHVEQYGAIWAFKTQLWKVTLVRPILE